MKGRIPPHDLEAERAVIGGVLVNEAAVSVVAEIIKPGDFYSETHRVIYEGATRLAARGEPVDQLTLGAELTNVGEFDRVGGREYVFQIVESVPTAANIRHYAKTVREKALRRRIIDAGVRMVHEAYDEEPRDIDKALDAAEQLVYDVGQGRSEEGSSLTPTAELVGPLLDRAQSIHENGGDVSGIRSGFHDVDKITTGVRGGDLIVIAGRPAMGKTSYGLESLWYAAHTLNLPVAIFSMEMSKDQLMSRLVSSYSRIPMQVVESGGMQPEEWTRYTRAAAEVAKAPIWMDDSSGASIAEIRPKLRRLASKLASRGTPLGMVVVDYMQLMKGEARHGRQQEVSGISRGLKVLARDFDVPVLALSQLSRAVEQRDDSRPMLSDLRESGSIEQDADKVLALYRDEYYNEDSEDRGIAEVLILKHRNGPTGKARLAFEAKLASFKNLQKGY